MKNIFKATLAIAAVGLGSYKAYDSYVASNMSTEDLLFAENIEALASSSEGDNRDHTLKEIKGNPIKKCWRRHTSSNTVACDAKNCNGRKPVYVFDPENKQIFECSGTLEMWYIEQQGMQNRILKPNEKSCTYTDSQQSSPDASQPCPKSMTGVCPKCYY